MIQRANSKFRISERDPESGTVSSRHEPMMQGLQRRLAWLGLHKKAWASSSNYMDYKPD